MFVSSYNTYIHTNTIDKTAKAKDYKSVDSSKSFATKLLHTSQIATSNIKNTPINYIDNSKIFHNRQKLQQNEESREEIINVNKFNSSASVKTAKVAYTANSVMFSIVAKPKSITSPTNLSLKGNEDVVLREKLSAINTYLSNDKYYRITA